MRLVGHGTFPSIYDKLRSQVNEIRPIEERVNDKEIGKRECRFWICSHGVLRMLLLAQFVLDFALKCVKRGVLTRGIFLFIIINRSMCTFWSQEAFKKLLVQAGDA